MLLMLKLKSPLLLSSLFLTVFAITSCHHKKDKKAPAGESTCEYAGYSGSSPETCANLKAKFDAGELQPIPDEEAQEDVLVTCVDDKFLATIKDEGSLVSLELNGSCDPKISCDGAMLKASSETGNASASLSSPAACKKAAAIIDLR